MRHLEVLFLGLTCCLAAACAAKVSQSPTGDYCLLSFNKIWELGQSLEDRGQKEHRKGWSERPVSPIALQALVLPETPSLSWSHEAQCGMQNCTGISDQEQFYVRMTQALFETVY